MPELPEVETIARGLHAALAGRTLARLEVLAPSSLKTPAERSAALIEGRTVLCVRRRAKLCLLDLGTPGHAPTAHLAFHLKMTGRLLAVDIPPPPHPHLRLVFHLADGGALLFQDMRRFGSCHAFTPAELATWPFFQNLGPEPLDLDADAFIARFASRPGPIKALLLDQTAIAGIGNIYADEALHRSGIHPETRASTLSTPRLHRLHQAVQDVLRQAIAENGSSIRDYLTAGGNPGGFQNHFLAYGRSGQPCTTCRTSLRHTKVAGRTSTFCPRCQKG